MIQSVNSNTSLTLDKNFAENTATNSTYRILLNTAAHFPSDTAAKVERALEQLSDINEAAINNNRTVTAATKVNGKGITSVMGNLDLNPTSVNANQGGCIYFHYNQSSSNTAAIFEHEQGMIRINGDFYLNGKYRNSINRAIGFTRGINTSSNTDYMMISNTDENDKNVARIINNVGYSASNNYTNSLGMYIYNPINASANGNVANIAVGYNQNGAFTSAPTPPVNSNDTNIATTAFVNNRLPGSPNFINFANATVPSGEWYILGSYTFLTTGIYLISFLGMFPGNASGYRVISIRRDGVAGDAMDRWSSISQIGFVGASNKFILTRAHTAVAGDTLNFNCYQNSGSSLSTVYSGIVVQRIKETF